MVEYTVNDMDIAVIGAGHAGIEAALAAARLGCRTVLFTLSMDLIGNMPCNPSIGGTGKGQLVCELNSLGGEMGRAADFAMLQSRMLNSSKGPAVHSLRMQENRRAYSAYMKRTLENTPNLSLVQAEVTELRTDENGAVAGVLTRFGAFYSVRCAVIASGTSLGGKIIVGETSYQAGPDNTLAASELTRSLENAGVKIMRFKTGTPPRIHSDSIDYTALELQEGDSDVPMFSDEYERRNTAVCHIAYTNEKTHEIIRANLSRSPLFSGMIKGTGPRYCPSIEDKVVRFADKTRHQLFVEPLGDDTKEMYLQGLSSSLPEEVQKQIVHSIRGFEHAVIMRPAYAIEYDCCEPTQLDASLCFKDIPGLYGAGQFNGSSGYEEAAVQGLIAGINAALRVKGDAPFTLSRSESYIGTLIDDLTVKGTAEPYRIMTSRSEYRLLLRQDNSDARLLEKGYGLGLVSAQRHEKFLAQEKALAAELKRVRETTLPLSDGLRALFAAHSYAEPEGGIRVADVLRRPGITYRETAPLDTSRPDLSEDLAFCVETEIKYEGYIKRQKAEVERFCKLENKQLPPDIDYTSIKGIRIEAMQKLQMQRPLNVGQASRISGVSPADISVLLIYLAGGARS
ncbi:MAG TPA: tRNA uridine-5-carboxymethylaminomethyl(34) synthesis enzyme MnmG [Bacillota bacterium]|nr:tRNA uridine-5-carboxymethylaminomethyl(34) synthesis enzyme MnmG [Bacillota bacterium]